jgi:hypothetical protein
LVAEVQKGKKQEGGTAAELPTKLRIAELETFLMAASH